MQNIDETKPLLAPDDDLEDKPGRVQSPTGLAKSFVRRPTASLVKHLSDQGEEEQLDVQNDVMMYNNNNLVTWSAFYLGPNSVFKSKDLWAMMLRLGVVAIVVGILTLLLVPDPAALQIAKFTEVTKFLNVVIGLMLGFFLSSSAKHWHGCVNGFLELLDAIRNLQLQFKALGLPDEQTTPVIRYGLASAWLLYGDLLLNWQRFTRPKGELDAEMWGLLCQQRVNLGTGDTRLLEDWEVDHLEPMRDPPGMMWMWISNMIGIMSQRKLVPGMATPTYGRIMHLCQCGHGGIRAVRAAVVIQAPLPYTHTLAVLVHMNNALNAILLGLVIGTSSGTWMARHRVHLYGARASSGETSTDLQMLAVTFLYCFFGPLLYQSLLIMAFHLAQPFDHEDASMPLDLLLHRLEMDLRNASQLRIPDSEKARPPEASDQHTPLTMPQVTKSPSTRSMSLKGPSSKQSLC